MALWWIKRKKVKRKKRASSVTKHFEENRETARALALARLHYFNQHYGLTWNRITIRNQRRRWGSCTSLKNINFNYKIIFLPTHLQDYIIVHELCHLVELNHGQGFWDMVAEQIPQYKTCVAELRVIDALGHTVPVLAKVQKQYQEYVTSSRLC